MYFIGWLSVMVHLVVARRVAMDTFFTMPHCYLAPPTLKAPAPSLSIVSEFNSQVHCTGPFLYIFIMILQLVVSTVCMHRKNISSNGLIFMYLC